MTREEFDHIMQKWLDDKTPDLDSQAQVICLQFIAERLETLNHILITIAKHKGIYEY